MRRRNYAFALFAGLVLAVFGLAGGVHPGADIMMATASAAGSDLCRGDRAGVDDSAPSALKAGGCCHQCDCRCGCENCDCQCGCAEEGANCECEHCNCECECGEAGTKCNCEHCKCKCGCGKK